MKVKEFIMKLDGSDEELLNKLGACKNPDEAYDVAKSYGVDESQEVFVAEMTKFYDAVRELNNDELENVAGGIDTSVVVETLVLSAAAATGAAISVAVGVGSFAAAAAA